MSGPTEPGTHERDDAEALIAADIEAFSTVGRRFSGSEGERAMLHAVRERVPAGVDARAEGFVGHTSAIFLLGLHGAILLFGALVGYVLPTLGLVVCLATTVSLYGEGTGRFQLLRVVLPKKPSYNLSVRLTQARALGTVVIATPLDVPRWTRHEARWRARPLRYVLAAAVVVCFILALRAVSLDLSPRMLSAYVVALAVLAGTVFVGAILHRRVGEGRDDGSGAATTLEAMRRIHDDPPADIEVWFVFTGCAYAFQHGIDHFLRLHARTLVDPVLVLALENPGRTPLEAVVSEGSLWREDHRATGPALVERLEWAGVRLPAVDRPGATDARQAALRGLRALALRGGEAPGGIDGVLRAATVVETVARWYAHDLAGVASRRDALEDLARATHAPRRRRLFGRRPAAIVAEDPPQDD